MDVIGNENLSESMTALFADLTLHLVRSNRFHAGTGKHNLLIDDDSHEYKRGYCSKRGRITWRCNR